MFQAWLWRQPSIVNLPQNDHPADGEPVWCARRQRCELLVLRYPLSQSYQVINQIDQPPIQTLPEDRNFLLRLSTSFFEKPNNELVLSQPVRAWYANRECLYGARAWTILWTETYFGLLALIPH